MTDISFRIAGITNDSIVDGPGLRFVIFFQGCKLNCYNCHNPQTHDLNGGYNILMSELLNKIDANPLLQGVTFSGGEPFLQADKLIVFANEIKKRNLDITVYSGYTFTELNKNLLRKKLLSCCDILIDGKYVDSKKTLDGKFIGSKNQRIIDLNKSFKENKIILWKDKWSA